MRPGPPGVVRLRPLLAGRQVLPGWGMDARSGAQWHIRRFAARSGATVCRHLFADVLLSASFCRRPFSAARPLGTVPLFCARRNSPDQLLLVSVSSPLRPRSVSVPSPFLSRSSPRPCPVPVPFLSRSCPVPVPFLSRSCPVPVPSRPCPVPVPVPFLSRSCPVPVPSLSLSLSLSLSRSCPCPCPCPCPVPVPFLSPLRSVPSPLRPVPVPFLSPSPLLAGRRFVAFFRSEG